MRVGIIIPTYNERENISPLIDAIQQEIKKMPQNMQVLVVDDNSPDSTAEIVKSKMKEYSNVHLISGKKQGLGAAYIRGMKYAIEVMKVDVIMEMDADFSHNPKDIPRIIAALDKDTDFVIASRYIQGGKIPENWGFLRKMNSKCGNIFARYIAGMYDIHDCTAGFRAIRTSVLKNLNLSNLRVQGYAFQIALLHKAIINNAVVKEIPVEFVDRIKGDTKIGLSDVIEFIINAWWIRFESSKTFLKFAIIGILGIIVNLGSFTALLNSGLNKFIASPIAIGFAIMSNFFLNNIWTFSKKNKNNGVYLKGLRFNVVSFITFSSSCLTFVLLAILFPDMMPHIHQAIGIIPAALVNYLLNSYWEIRAKSLTN